MANNKDLCEVQWCVALRAPNSVYCAVHRRAPDAFKQKDAEIAKKQTHAHNAKMERIKKQAEGHQRRPSDNRK